MGKEYFAHETAVIDGGCKIGKGTKIWHFTHIMSNCIIGENCNIGQNVVVSPDVVLGITSKFKITFLYIQVLYVKMTFFLDHQWFSLTL